MLKIKAFIMLMILSMSLVTVATAQNESANTTANATVTQTTTPNTQTATTAPTVVATTVAQTTVVTAVPTEVKEKKFRVGPTVRIRPLNDEIKKDQDGLIEIYFDNPSVNTVSLTADVRVSVPSGVHVYGQGFGSAAAAGMVYGIFDVPPGTARTINLNIKAEKTGEFFAQFTGLYYPDDNKDAYQPMSLTHQFKVLEASADPTSANTAKAGEDGKIEKSPGMSFVGTILIVSMLAYLLRRK